MGGLQINWKTSIGALVALLSQLLPLVGVSIGVEVQGALITLGVFIVGLFAKDNNVTGGTKPATKEAETRINK